MMQLHHKVKSVIVYCFYCLHDILLLRRGGAVNRAEEEVDSVKMLEENKFHLGPSQWLGGGGGELQVKMFRCPLNLFNSFWMLLFPYIILVRKFGLPIFFVAIWLYLEKFAKVTNYRTKLLPTVQSN